MERSLHEIFTDVHEETSFAKKAKILKDNDTAGLRHLLRATYDDGVRWLVPSTTPPFEPNDAPEWDLADARLEQEALKIGRFIQVDGQTPVQGRELTRTRREELFIQLLEGLHPTEANLLMSGVKKKIKYKGLTKRVVDKAFPDLI